MPVTSSEESETLTSLVSAADEAQRCAPAYAVSFQDGRYHTFGSGSPAFILEVTDENQLERFLRSGTRALAVAFINGDFNVRGDLMAAVRLLRGAGGGGLADTLRPWLARFGWWRVERLFQTRRRAARNIRFHYDRSNEFYQKFLDSRLVYSCAYFDDPGASLEEAQLAKLRHVCRKLDLQIGERFLDIGSGWGALVFHAATMYGVQGTGCTLSPHQFSYASDECARRGLGHSVRFLEMDYRDLEGEFDKIASVGMFEHVGSRRLGKYFRKVSSLLAPDGLFLNHGIVRPQCVSDDMESLVLKRHVFPGGEFVHLTDIVREAEKHGFEILDLENLRLHYAMTCRNWVERLQENEEECLQVVDMPTYRTWLLFLAASSDSFERGQTDVHQVLMAKRDHPGNRRLSREYMYRL